MHFTVEAVDVTARLVAFLSLIISTATMVLVCKWKTEPAQRDDKENG